MHALSPLDPPAPRKFKTITNVLAHAALLPK